MNCCKWKWAAWLACVCLLLPAVANGQTEPDPDQENRLPHEFYPNDGNLPPGFPPNQELLGLNSAGAPRVISGHHSDVPKPPLKRIQGTDVLIPPNGGIPRYYIYCYYYGCRPWFIHPYTGLPLTATDIIASVHSENPDFSRGSVRSMEDLLKVDEDLGEAPVVVEDLGLVDENNDGAIADCEQQDEAEKNNAEAAGVPLTVRKGIHRAPFYGLYCLRVRICIPIFDILNHCPDNQIRRWRFWCKFRFPRTQPICWSRTWWYRWYPPFHPWWNNQLHVLRPWRPWCLPHVFWTRSGPDWVCNVQSVNRFRHWCLFGFRYYFPRVASANNLLQFDAVNPLRVPYMSQLNANLQPQQWLRPYPYPVLRYWPFRPYCTRWYWFRCFPWYWYRHFPPIIQFATAVPNAELNDGFLDNAPDVDPASGAPLFPPGPPNFADGSTLTATGLSSFDSFFDIDVECRGRAELSPPLDENGDGRTNNADLFQLGVRQTSALGPSQDADNLVEPPRGPAPPPASSRRSRR